VNAASTAVPATTAAPVPFDLVLVNVGGGLFDTTLYEYVVPSEGPYHFDYTVTLNDTGAGSVSNGTVIVYAEVGSAVSTQNVQMISLTTSFSQQAQTKTLSGSAIIELLEGQTIRLSSANVSGNSSSSIAGPSTASVPPYPTVFSGYSLF